MLSRLRGRTVPVRGRTVPGASGAADDDLPLLRWKLHRWFACLDTDRDGRLTSEDYDLAAARLARAFNHRPGQREHRRLLARYRKLWALHDPGGRGELDRDAFTEQLLAAGRDRARPFRASLNRLCCALVDIADTDGDDQVSEREYRVLLSAAFGLTSERDLTAAYRMLDRDGSGTLEHNEIHAAVLEYFTSNAPDAPGNWLLGPPPAALLD
ncbi:EF-hand domain-containing protein [Streptomyces sp. NPDC087440]|uniref:EF-hand domain-containing protein n=1 Tax=Streptomyces sp. NPDC087440 TaxID=3365790 RepID=UPI0037F70AFB